MNHRIDILAILGSLFLCFLILELIRKKRLMERYALLWFASVLIITLFAVWRSLLDKLAAVLGIYYAPSALFLLALFCGLVLVLHFTLVISKLTEQNKTLTQSVALLKNKVDSIAEHVQCE
ncbi:DUF2304 domain-containing protein [candidate division KSB1 bacterium]|nr:DUF2304 domain-containing protein [candidate division KSB1 bacterium]